MQSFCYNLIWYLCIEAATSPYRTFFLAGSGFLALFQLILFYHNITFFTASLCVFLFLMGNLLSALPVFLGWASYPSSPKGFFHYFPLWLTVIWASFILFVLPLILKYCFYPFTLAIVVGGGFVAAYYYGCQRKALICVVKASWVLALIGIIQGAGFGLVAIGLQFLQS